MPKAFGDSLFESTIKIYVENPLIFIIIYFEDINTV